MDITHLLRYILESIEREVASLPTVAEAGRVFSNANEQALRAVAVAINNLLAQVQQAPAAQPVAGPTAGAPVAGAPTPVQVQQAILPYAEPMSILAQESVIPLSEAAKGGKGLIKVIDAGWGSSGFYDRAVLARDAGVAFPSGTKMYWDHPTTEEARTRPERSLRDLAAETTGPASWMDDGPQGPAVYAPASVFSSYRPAVEELREHIGVSIRTPAMVRNGEAEGKRGPIIERLLPSPTNSIDFVTIPGRGGRVVALFEAARGQNTDTEVDDVSEAELKAAQEAQTAAEARATEAEARAQRAETAAAVLAASRVAADLLRTVDLPDAAKEAIVARATANPPIKDGALDADALKVALTAEAGREAEYIAKLTGKGEVRNMGSGGSAAGTTTAPQTTEALTGALQRLGMSESAAKVAAAGRGH